MSDEAILRVGHVSEVSDGCEEQVRRALHGPNIEHMEPIGRMKAIESLRKGDLDLVAMSGISAFASNLDGLNVKSEFSVAAVLPRREPTFVLVSRDKTEYLPKRGVVNVPSRLVARQLKRSRPDLHLNIRKSDGSELFYSDSSKTELHNLIEKSESGELDGFVLERAVWECSGIKARRHTLGMNLEGDEERFRFIPAPLRGFSLLISRVGFPDSLLPNINDEMARIVWKIESSLTRQMLHPGDLVGLHVQIRRSNTILRTSGEEDHLITEWWHDTVRQRPTHMLEMLAEIVDHSGRVTVSLEKRYPLDDAHYASKIFVNEWSDILELAMSENAKDIRLGAATPAMLRLEEE